MGSVAGSRDWLPRSAMTQLSLTPGSKVLTTLPHLLERASDKDSEALFR